jgi:hypothetical protein
MDGLCQPQPAPEPKSTDGEILQLEPYTAAAVAESELSISDENPLKKICDVIFERPQRASVVNFNSQSTTVRDAYEFFSTVDFNSDEIGGLRLSDGATVREGDQWVFDSFGLPMKIMFSSPFKIQSCTTIEMWNAFVNILGYAKTQEKVGGIHEERSHAVWYVLDDNFKYTDLKKCMSRFIAEKLTGVFLTELDSAVSGPPLSEFFTVRQSTVRQGFIFAFICSRVSSCLEELASRLRSWSAESLQDCLKLTKAGDISGENIGSISEDLALERTSVESSMDGGKVAADKFNQLMERLDATVRKLLAETPFEFVLKFDASYKPEKSAEMPILEYFEVAAKKWAKKKKDGESQSNGERLEAAKAEARTKKDELLSPIDFN